MRAHAKTSTDEATLLGKILMGLNLAALEARLLLSKGDELAEFKPIGTIRTPHLSLQGMPIQPPGAIGVRGTVEILDEYRDGLADLDGFSHIILLYHFHRSSGFRLRVRPFMDTSSRGLFATRAPRRPNAIGLSVVRLDKVEAGSLHVLDVDMLDRTPLLDIKPFVPAFDGPSEVRVGWLAEAQKRVSNHRSDERFIDSPPHGG